MQFQISDSLTVVEKGSELRSLRSQVCALATGLQGKRGMLDLCQLLLITVLTPV